MRIAIRRIAASPVAQRWSAMLAVALLVICATPTRAAAQAAAKAAADAPSRSAETRAQTDSLTMYFVRSPKGKPAALSVGGKTAAQARKLNGKAEPSAPQAPVNTPLPTRARSTKP
jgi:NAD(P)H-dependent FMN reductase